MKKEKGKVREDFRCSEILHMCLQMESKIKEKSIIKIVERAVIKFLHLSEEKRNEEIITKKGNKEISFLCSKELSKKIYQEGNRLNIPNDELIRRAMYRYFKAKKEEELKGKSMELKRKKKEKEKKMKEKILKYMERKRKR